VIDCSNRMPRQFWRSMANI